MAAVYKITNIQNGKVYVGPNFLTNEAIVKREDHKQKLRMAKLGKKRGSYKKRTKEVSNG